MVNMNKLLVAKTLRNAADGIGGEPSVKDVLDGLLARTGKTEEILAALADLYAEKAKTEEYANMASRREGVGGAPAVLAGWDRHVQNGIL